MQHVLVAVLKVTICLSNLNFLNLIFLNVIVYLIYFSINLKSKKKLNKCSFIVNWGVSCYMYLIYITQY